MVTVDRFEGFGFGFGFGNGANVEVDGRDVDVESEYIDIGLDDVEAGSVQALD